MFFDNQIGQVQGDVIESGLERLCDVVANSGLYQLLGNIKQTLCQ
jgi:hypothetical protein